MLNPLPAAEVLNREFLPIRARLLELAATLDRLDRGGPLEKDPRLDLIRRGLQVVSSDHPNRAEELQLLFSQPYLSDWQQQFAQQESANGDQRSAGPHKPR